MVWYWYFFVYCHGMVQFAWYGMVWYSIVLVWYCVVLCDGIVRCCLCDGAKEPDGALSVKSLLPLSLPICRLLRRIIIIIIIIIMLRRIMKNIFLDLSEICNLAAFSRFLICSLLFRTGFEACELLYLFDKNTRNTRAWVRLSIFLSFLAFKS